MVKRESGCGSHGEGGSGEVQEQREGRRAAERHTQVERERGDLGRGQEM